MTRIIIFVVSMVLMMVLPAGAIFAADPQLYANPYLAFSDNYIIRQGDEIALSVIVDGEQMTLSGIAFPSKISGAMYAGTPSDGNAKVASNVYVVSLDGTIACAYVDKITVAGNNLAFLVSQYTKEFRKYYLDPQVTAKVTKWHATQVCVLGQMPAPKVVELGIGMNRLSDAIAQAGGFNRLSAKKNIFVIRRSQPYNQPLKIDLLKFLEQGDVSQNVELYDGDVVYVTDNGKVDIFGEVIPAIGSIANFYAMWDSILRGY